MTETRPFITGERVRLRGVEERDLSLIAGWMNDEEVTYYMFTGQRPMTVSQVGEEIHRQIESGSNALFVVEDLKTIHPIGIAGLYDIHPTARKAEFRILLGDRECWNRGYGTETTELLAFYGFDRLNLNKIWLGVTAENAGAVRAYEKAGFSLEGRLREDLYRNSRYYDSVRMSILRSEYYPERHAQHTRRFQARPPEGGRE